MLNISALTDPKGALMKALDKMANAMLFLGESNNRLAEAIERNGLPK